MGEAAAVRVDRQSHDYPSPEKVANSILKQLPVMPRVIPGVDIESVYLRERDAVRSKTELQAFVRRWRAIWRLPEQRDLPLSYEERLLASGGLRGRSLHYAFRWFVRLRARQDGPRANTGKHWRLAAHLMAPPALIRAYFVAEYFGAPSDIALIQLYDGQDLL